MKPCDKCKDGFVIDKMRAKRETYLGVRGYINYYYSECMSCNSKSESGWQINVNRDNHLYYHRMVEAGFKK